MWPNVTVCVTLVAVSVFDWTSVMIEPVTLAMWYEPLLSGELETMTSWSAPKPSSAQV